MKTIDRAIKVVDVDLIKETIKQANAEMKRYCLKNPPGSRQDVRRIHWELDKIKDKYEDLFLRTNTEMKKNVPFISQLKALVEDWKESISEEYKTFQAVNR